MEKQDIKPFIDTMIKDTIYKISFVTGYSVKSMCEDFCNHVFKSGLGNELSPYFKRDITIDGMEFKGNKKAVKFEPISENSERISMKINSDAYEYAYHLSYAVGCSVAKIVGYAVEKCMRDFDYLSKYIDQFLCKSLNEEGKNSMKDIVDIVNEDFQEGYGAISLVMYIGDKYRRFNEGAERIIKDVDLIKS